MVVTHFHASLTHRFCLIGLVATGILIPAVGIGQGIRDRTDTRILSDSKRTPGAEEDRPSASAQPKLGVKVMKYNLRPGYTFADGVKRYSLLGSYAFLPHGSSKDGGQADGLHSFALTVKHSQTERQGPPTSFGTLVVAEYQLNADNQLGKPRNDGTRGFERVPFQFYAGISYAEVRNGSRDIRPYLTVSHTFDDVFSMDATLNYAHVSPRGGEDESTGATLDLSASYSVNNDLTLIGGYSFPNKVDGEFDYFVRGIYSLSKYGAGFRNASLRGTLARDSIYSIELNFSFKS